MNTKHSTRIAPNQATRIHTLRTTVTPTFDYDVAVVGLGYVGLPTALAHHESGLRVLALDASPERLLAIGSGLVDLGDTDLARLDNALRDDQFQLTIDASELSRARSIIVCVPTPVDHHLVPDLSLLRAACATVVARTVPGQLVMLTSTTYVGCTQDFLVATLRRRGLEVGEDIFVAFSAERIDPGSQSVEQEAVPRVVGGATPACEERAIELLSTATRHIHPVPSLETAEMTKLLENTFRAVNIALVNEFSDICHSLDIDVTHVIDAAATKPYGFMAFRPGPGVGGHCIPCDPHYLLWQLRRSRVEAPLMTEAMHQVAARPRRVIDRIRGVLAERGMPISGTRILVVGVAYKPDVADVRESPALEILQRLREEGASVGFVDSHVPTVRLEGGEELHSVADPETFKPELVLLHTLHHDTGLGWMPTDQLLIDTTYQHALTGQQVSL